MSSLASSALVIQDTLAASAAFDDFTVSHKQDDGAEEIVVSYQLTDDDTSIEASEAAFSKLEADLGLKVAKAGPSGDGFFIRYVAA